VSFASGSGLTLVSLPHAKLSVLYRQLAQQLSAGLTLSQALRAPSPAPLRERSRLAAMAEGGSGVAAIMGAAGDWLPQRDRPFLIAGADSGRLPLVLANLADRHAQMASTNRRVFFASIYPLVVFHFGALVLPFIRMIDFEKGLCWSTPGYIGGLLAILLPVWGGAALLFALVRRGNPAANALLDMLPAIGGYRRHQALADFSFALGNLLEAGTPIGKAWLDAGAIARSPKLRRASERVLARIERGEAPGAHLEATGAFPDDFVARYQTAERAGALEGSLLALAADHQERANGRLAAASMLYPGLLFAAVAAMIAYLVFGFVLKYVNTLNSMMDGL
jgi:type II secretory pathway component PulF